jgi:hypothetical protein
MAEIFGLSASIITVLDLCTKSLKFLRDIHSAPKECARLQVAISSIRGLVDELGETATDAQTAPNNARLRSIPTLVQNESPLACLQDTLQSLTDKLDRARSATGIKKVGKRVGWPFTKEDIRTTLGLLKLHQKTLSLAFQNDTFLIAQDIYKSVKLIQEDADITRKESSIVRKDIGKVGDNLGVLTVISKEKFERVEGKIIASASKTSLDIEKVSGLISVASQENRQSLETLRALIKTSGIRYTAQDFVYLDRSKRTKSWIFDGKGDEDERNDEDDEESEDEESEDEESEDEESEDEESEDEESEDEESEDEESGDDEEINEEGHFNEDIIMEDDSSDDMGNDNADSEDEQEFESDY